MKLGETYADKIVNLKVELFSENLFIYRSCRDLDEYKVSVST